jgi:hypothetical protein
MGWRKHRDLVPSPGGTEVNHYTGKSNIRLQARNLNRMKQHHSFYGARMTFTVSCRSFTAKFNKDVKARRLLRPFCSRHNLFQSYLRQQIPCLNIRNPWRQLLLQGAKPRIASLSPQSPSAATRLAMSTSAHLHSDVLLSKVFSILFQKTTLLGTVEWHISVGNPRNIFLPSERGAVSATVE